MRSISFVIPLYNGGERLKKIFEALRLAQGRLPRGFALSEVIFVDNGSKDKTFTKLSEFAQEIPTLPVSIVSYKDKLSEEKAIEEGIRYSVSKLNIALKPDLSNLKKELKKLSHPRLNRGKKPKKRKRRPPLVSVIMPVQNSQDYLDKAIESVLSQTFKDFEFIIIDDHSSDKSWGIIKKYERRSRRIRTLRNHKKLGLPVSLKHGVEMALGNYITKIDSDNLCYTTRFEKQVKHLEKNKRTVAVGTQYLFVNERGKKINKKSLPPLFERVSDYIYRFLPVQQPALMIAKKRLPRNFDFYNYGTNSLEDIELVYKLSKYGKVEKLPHTLLRYRTNNGYSFLTTLRKIYFLFSLSRTKGAL